MTTVFFQWSRLAHILFSVVKACPHFIFSGQGLPTFYFQWSRIDNSFFSVVKAWPHFIFSGQELSKNFPVVNNLTHYIEVWSQWFSMVTEVSPKVSTVIRYMVFFLVAPFFVAVDQPKSGLKVRF